jgi:hypothetical protein
MGWSPRSTATDVRSAVSAHADNCRLRLRAALLANRTQGARSVVNRILLTQAEQKRFTMWRKVGLSRSNAMRIVCDLSMGRGLA